MLFADALARNSGLYADKVALEFLDPPFQHLTYSELDDLVRRSAEYLKSLGVSPGDRVALQLPKCPEFVALNLATLHLGAISLPLNPAYPADEIEYFLRDSGARIFFSSRSMHQQLEPVLPNLRDLQTLVALQPGQPQDFLFQLPPARAKSTSPGSFHPEDTAVIVYTSGTTGRPKGAEITHRNLAANLASLHTAWGWQADDILLHVLPIFHIHGLFAALYGALYAGATTLMMRDFDASRTLQALAEGPCTILMAVPTIHRRLLAASVAGRVDLSHMRLITSGSDRLPDEIYRGFQGVFNYTLVERYGLTETGLNCSNPLNGERRMGSVGRPLPGVETRIADPESALPLADGQVGEVQVRGANVFKGYWRQPEKTAEVFTADGWFRTGDLGFQQPDGYLVLRGRSKDLIVSGGMNVYPPEVERVLGEHPAVEACAVVGCPDPDWGERVMAVVVLKDAARTSAEDLISFCRQRLAPYKCPRSVVLSKELPRNAMGKVQKSELRDSLCS